MTESLDSYNLPEDLFHSHEMYLARYPDVAEAKKDPVQHYIEFGFRENRELGINRSAFKLQDLGDGSTRSILFISHHKKSEAVVRYRCTNIATLLRQQGWKAEVISIPETRFDLSWHAIAAADIVVFARTPLTRTTTILLQIARDNKKKIVFELDDGIFPWLSEQAGVVLSEYTKEEDLYKNRQRECVVASVADAIICSTDVISEELAFLDLPTLVLRNYIAQELVYSKTIVREDNASIKILFASGTPTHLADFWQWAGPLTEAIKQYPGRFEITILGEATNISSYLANYFHKVTHINLVTYEKMLAIMRDHDLLFVPLIQNRFNDCKSALKFIEAGSQGTAVLATAVAEYKKAIVHRHNGWLFDSGEGLATVIKEIVLQPGLLSKVGFSALHAVTTPSEDGNRLSLFLQGLLKV